MHQVSPRRPGQTWPQGPPGCTECWELQADVPSAHRERNAADNVPRAAKTQFKWDRIWEAFLTFSAKLEETPGAVAGLRGGVQDGTQPELTSVLQFAGGGGGLLLTPSLPQLPLQRLEVGLLPSSVQ